MDVDQLLENEDDKALLMDSLERHMENCGFDRRIGEFIDSIVTGKLSDVTDINQIFNQLHEFVVVNLPPEVQEAFYYDVRSFIDKNVRVEEQ